MKKKLKLAIVDGEGEKLLRENTLFLLLAQEYELEISDDPDVVFYSDHFWQADLAPEDIEKLLYYPCLKVFFTGENQKPDFRHCDYAFSFMDTDERNFQLPNFTKWSYFWWVNPREKSRSCANLYSQLNNGYARYDELQAYRAFPKSRFCNFVYDNENAEERIQFCKKLMAYKRVDCPSTVLCNMPRSASRLFARYKVGIIKRDVLTFFRHYKFTIAFENQSAVNYTTEKIFRSLLVGSIPIYWGNPRVAEFFNPEAFINCHDYDSFERVIERVIEVDNDDRLFQKYVTAPPIIEGSKLCAITEQAVTQRLKHIIGSIGVTAPISTRFSYRLRSFMVKRLRRTQRLIQASPSRTMTV